jgi:hypothetical protein
MPPTADSRECPARCGREKRSGDLLCRRCWYIVPDDLKSAYITARNALRADRSRRNAEALLAARRCAIQSANPTRSN